MGTTSNDAEKREYDAETDILRQREHRMTPDTVKQERYAIQTGAAGTWTVIRRVDKDCPDYEDGPIEEFYSSVCICASPSTAVKIAEAIEQLFPNGDIV